MEELYGYEDSHGNKEVDITREKLDEILELKMDLLLGGIKMFVWRTR